MTWRQVHEQLAWAAVLANAGVGLWALGAHWRPVLRTRWLWWSTAVAQVALFVQAGLGAAIIAQEDIEPDDMHLLYGFTSLVAVGIIYSYRQQLEQWRYLLYGLGGLFLMGMSIRAMVLTPR